MGIDGDGWEYMGMDGDGWGWMGMDGDGWGWMRMDADECIYKLCMLNYESTSCVIHYSL